MHLCGGDGPLTRTQHESLEKQNHALQKEIQALQAELAWWTQALHVHERLCPLDCASCLAPGAAGCWGQAEQPPGSAPHGQRGCQEQLGLFRTPASSPSAPQPSPDPQPRGSLGLLLSPLPSLSLGPAAVTASPARQSPSPAQSASPAGSGLLRPSSKLNTLLPSPTAQPAPLEFLRLEHPTRGKPGSTPHSPSAAPGLGSLQGREHKPASSAADWQGLDVDPSPHPLLDFPLLSSAQVHF
ncbi:basic leucine zipper transcriptional factor ATF-like 2 isoform X3 [Ovis canadensis]|uniref:basic leucine zipper transcriptional factor ATF-like 2 isoform X3 n=1 Tax=Ovis canadensis TaxID=37174 RepID=UPI00375003A3